MRKSAKRWERKTSPWTPNIPKAHHPLLANRILAISYSVSEDLSRECFKQNEQVHAHRVTGYIVLLLIQPEEEEEEEEKEEDSGAYNVTGTWNPETHISIVDLAWCDEENIW